MGYRPKIATPSCQVRRAGADAAGAPTRARKNPDGHVAFDRYRVTAFLESERQLSSARVGSSRLGTPFALAMESLLKRIPICRDFLAQGRTPTGSSSSLDEHRSRPKCHWFVGTLEPSSRLEPAAPSLPWPRSGGEFLGGIPHEHWAFSPFVSSSLDSPNRRKLRPVIADSGRTAN